MLLSCFQRGRTIWCFDCAPHQRRANSTDSDLCQLQYLTGLRGEDVYARLSNCLMNFMLSVSPFPGVCLNTQWFQGTSVFYLRCRDSVVPDSFWHASCLVLTPRVWDRLVHARSLWSSRNPCWQLLSWHHASPKASKLPLYILHVPGKKKKKLQVQIK